MRREIVAGGTEDRMWKVLLVTLIILIIVLVVLYFLGQTVRMLIIDNKRLPVKKSGLPQMVIDQTPWYLRRSKMPIVKAKIGPKIMTLVADASIYDLLPVKREVKVVVSGIYITAIKSARGGIEKPEPKKGFFKRLFKK